MLLESLECFEKWLRTLRKSVAYYKQDIKLANPFVHTTWF